MENKVIKIEPEDDDDAEKQHEKDPPRNVTRNIRGQTREYNFLESVNSVEELDKIRFKNCCTMNGRIPVHAFKSHTMSCPRQKRSRYQPEKRCHFELLALRQSSVSGTIHVYSHGEHNHPILPEEKRAIIGRGRAKEMMPAENPPQIFRTPDKIEWTFLQTHIHPIMPEDKQHPAAACDHQKQKQQEMDEDDDEEEEEEENDEDGQEENEAEEEDEEIDDEEDEEEGEFQNEPINEAEEGGGEDQDQREEKREGSSVENNIEIKLEHDSTPREETLMELEERLQTATAKVYTWMAGLEPIQIGPTLERWDNSYLLKMVEIGDQEIREHPEKLDLWRPFLKCAIKKCMSQTEDFATKYKDLNIQMMDRD